VRSLQRLQFAENRVPSKFGPALRLRRGLDRVRFSMGWLAFAVSNLVFTSLTMGLLKKEGVLQ